MKFKDQVVVVTGSSRGIGKAIAEAFAKEGAAVMVLARNERACAEVADGINQRGFQAEGFVCDVTNALNVQNCVNKILDKYKRVDILINNAGITKDNLLLRMSDEEWNDVMNTNLRGVFNFTKTLSKVFLKAKRGKIINISSIIGITGNAGQANYAASKAGIIGFTKSVAKELASRGITVNAVAPGYIETEMTGQLKPDIQEKILGSIPLGRLGTADDVASVCLFLASPEADYITGQTIVIDGGLAI